MFHIKCTEREGKDFLIMRSNFEKEKKFLLIAEYYEEFVYVKDKSKGKSHTYKSSAVTPNPMNNSRSQIS